MVSSNHYGQHLERSWHKKTYWVSDEVASSFVSEQGIGGGTTWPVVLVDSESSLTPIVFRRRPFL